MNSLHAAMVNHARAVFSLACSGLSKTPCYSIVTLKTSSFKAYFPQRKEILLCKCVLIHHDTIFSKDTMFLKNSNFSFGCSMLSTVLVLYFQQLEHFVTSTPNLIVFQNVFLSFFHPGRAIPQPPQSSSNWVEYLII